MTARALGPFKLVRITTYPMIMDWIIVDRIEDSPLFRRLGYKLKFSEDDTRDMVGMSAEIFRQLKRELVR